MSFLFFEKVQRKFVIETPSFGMFLSIRHLFRPATIVCRTIKVSERRITAKDGHGRSQALADPTAVSEDICPPFSTEDPRGLGGNVFYRGGGAS